MNNLQEALTKIKEEEKRKKNELEKKQVRFLFFYSFSGKVAIIGQCIITSHICLRCTCNQNKICVGCVSVKNKYRSGTVNSKSFVGKVLL